jgi:hypothetical protein
MSTPPAGALPPFFVPDGEAFVATESTRGPWSRQHQHGGPPAALLGRAMEQLVGDGALLIRVLGAETEPQAVRRLVAALASPSSCRQGGRSRPADPSLWSASPVTWRKLARLGIRPIRQALRQGEAAGRFYQIPLARFRWGSSGRTQGARTACSRQERGVDASSDPSEPPMGSPHRLQSEPRLRNAHLAPEAGSGRRAPRNGRDAKLWRRPGCRDAVPGWPLTIRTREPLRMPCPRCQHENPSGQKFCDACGTSSRPIRVARQRRHMRRSQAP